MKRRTLLAAASTTFLGGAGCLSPTVGPWFGLEGELPELIESVDFSIVDEGGSPPEPPSIEFDFAERRIRITGTMYAGNPCHQAGLNSITYDGDVDELRVLVSVEKVPFRLRGCPDSLGTDTYEVVIAFESSLPKTVTAVQRDSLGESRPTTASKPT